MNENPYQPPCAPCSPCTPPAHENLIPALKCQSTWLLLGLGVVTFGVYYAHYCLRQTRVINKHAGTNVIPPAVAVCALATGYASVALLIGYLFVEEHHPLAVASNISDRISMLPVMVWGFCARGAVNRLVPLREGDPHRISRLWTLLFSPLHFNYRINQLNEVPAGAPVVA